MTKIYGYSYEEFLDLPRKTQETVFKVAHKKNDPFVDQYFKTHPEIGWIVIARRSKKIIASGYSEEELLLDKIAKEQNRPIFAYSRPIDTEESQFPQDFFPEDNNIKERDYTLP
jgi:hypothetical protein